MTHVFPPRRLADSVRTLPKLIWLGIICLSITDSFAQGTRLLQQPTLSATHIAFVYGGDIWVSELNGQRVVRLTSTPAVERDPHFSPDGKSIAFTSNRSGGNAVYTVPAEGGTPTRLTWHPSASSARGWTPDGKKVLYASTRETAPTAYERLWTVPVEGGSSTLLTAQWGTNGSLSPDGNSIALDRVDRWDSEWRAYRGGQNTPLVVLNLKDWSETLIPNESTTDIQPLWIGETVYFLSDRDWATNVWAFTPGTGALKQITTFKGADIKWLGGNSNQLVIERDGYLHLLDPNSGTTTQLSIEVKGDFPWAETKWEDVSKVARSASLSPSGKRAIMEARGEVFTVPIENGDARNITQSTDAADRAPLWSPTGNEIAWFSDKDKKGYRLLIASQAGLSEPRTISIGESKMAWEPAWSPDGKYLAFTDDDVRIRIVDIKAGTIQTADVGGTNIERGSLGLTWSPDSQWLAYAKSGSNNFRRIHVWSQKDKSTQPLTDAFADAFSPAWDLDKKHLYFLASTEVALGSGWANTSAMTSDPEYAAYVVNLRKVDPSPFVPKSDEETAKEEDKPEKDTKPTDDSKKEKKTKSTDSKATAEKDTTKLETVQIDFEGIERRTMALPLPVRNYPQLINGPAGVVFIGEQKAKTSGLTLQKFTLKEAETKEYVSGASQISVSADGKKMLARLGGTWKVMDTQKPSGADGEVMKVDLKMKLDRVKEWEQMFEEAWRYERDYFYDPNMHGRNWQEVHDRYAPLVPYIRHRADLTTILDQINGELSVGHSFVFGGDYPEVEKPSVGLLGADLVADKNRWKIKKIYTTESWNPELSSPLDRPGIKAKEGYYLVGINGKEMSTTDDPYRFLDGTVDRQTVLHLNKTPDFEGAWKEIVKPISSENALRQRAWVEDNRRLVDKLSNGRLAYVWVPNTSGGGFVSFNRYYFAQQDKEGAVIDERFNGGGLLDDYMVDLMTRTLRAAVTNEAPNGTALRLPAGILGPKVLLINEMAGSGGDFFPWVFRQQKAGPLIGARTWGGLVKSSVHYPLVDGGALTAPDNAVFDPINKKWIAENEGVAPDIAVRQDAKSLANGTDPQLERAVKEALLLIDQKKAPDVAHPAYSSPALKKQ
ncbi:S41 family peptidase [Salmonirosea aquatica]|uniref:Tricorn protease homolog n=1 Tax=Salmonirosea aquatica TaxID=2654236 RepID=A0A7C9BI77_9BACT|nr:protease [Cytophagaceae bacterium SJW1-29]